MDLTMHVVLRKHFCKDFQIILRCFALELLENLINSGAVNTPMINSFKMFKKSMIPSCVPQYTRCRFHFGTHDSL